MSLTVHHLQLSQSERIPWLCEELDIPYTLKLYQRAPLLAPQAIKDLNPIGQAPIIQDGALTLAESAACVEYIIHKHGSGRLALPPSHKNYADYLYWFHFSNGTLQPQLSMLMQSLRFEGSESAGTYAAAQVGRFENMLKLMDARLAKNDWLAGDEFTAADIMTVFTFTTMRVFYPFDLTPYEGILGYLGRVVQREGYKRYRAKGDPELELMVDGKSPKSIWERLQAEGKS